MSGVPHPSLKHVGPPDSVSTVVALKSAAPRHGRHLRKFAQRVVKLFSRPFGLPTNVTVEDYRKDPICFLSTYNYKVAASIGPSVESTSAILTVFDTGAGPNLIRSACLSSAVLDNLQSPREFVNLSSASKHRIQVLGITNLSITAGDHTCRQPFLVVKNLNADAILGTTYIDSQVEYISPNAKLYNEKELLLRYRSEVQLSPLQAKHRNLQIPIHVL